VSAPIIVPNLPLSSNQESKPPEQMSADELVAASNAVRAEIHAAPPEAPVRAPDDVAGMPDGMAPPAPVAAPLPEGFKEYEVRPDGTIHTMLVTGEVFDGQPLEVAQKLAASKVATNNSYKEATKKLEALTPAAPVERVVEHREQVAATLSQLPPDKFAELYYQKLDDPAQATGIAMARLMGYDNVDEMKQDFIDMKSATETQRATQTAASFERECPEFPFTQEATEKLYEVMQSNNLPETLGNLKLAHAFCVQNKLYTPRSAEQITASRGGAKVAAAPAPNIPPMLAPQNEAAPATTNFANMTSDQIAAEYRRVKQQGG